MISKFQRSPLFPVNKENQSTGKAIAPITKQAPAAVSGRGGFWVHDFRAGALSGLPLSGPPSCPDGGGSARLRLVSPARRVPVRPGRQSVRRLSGRRPAPGPPGRSREFALHAQGGQTSFCIIPQSGGFGNRKFSHCSHSGPPGWGLLDNWPYCTAPLRTTVSAGMGPLSSSAISWFHWLISASVTYPSSMSFSRVWVMVG